jgi:hypothetical protein
VCSSDLVRSTAELARFLMSFVLGLGADMYR